MIETVSYNGDVYDLSARKEVLESLRDRSNVLVNPTNCVNEIGQLNNIVTAKLLPYLHPRRGGFVHSTDLLTALAPVIQMGLTPCEVIAKIDRLRFHSPIYSNLDVYMMEFGRGSIPETNRKLKFELHLVTNTGKKLTILGFERASEQIPKTRNWCDDSWEDKLSSDYPISESRNANGTVTYTVIMPSNRINKTAIDQLTTYNSSTILDLMMSAFVRLRFFTGIAKPGQILSAATFENFDISNVCELGETGGKIQLTIVEKCRKGKRNNLFITIKADIFSQNTRVAGGDWVLVQAC